MPYTSRFTPYTSRFTHMNQIDQFNVKCGDQTPDFETFHFAPFGLMALTALRTCS